MKIITIMDNKVTSEKKIKNLEGLDNSEMILFEKGDFLRKEIRSELGKIGCIFGNTSLFSVKGIKEAIDLKSRKEAKKASKGNRNVIHLCMICCEELTANKNGICDSCRIK